MSLLCSGEKRKKKFCPEETGCREATLSTCNVSYRCMLQGAYTVISLCGMKQVCILNA